MTNVSNYLDERLGRGLGEPITRPKDSGPVDPPPGPPHDGDMTMSSDRLSRLEQEVHTIKGSLDWAKVAFTILVAVTLGGISITLGGFTFLYNQIGSIRTELVGTTTSLRAETTGALTSLRSETTGALTSLRTETIGGLASLRTDLAAEARATRAELSATTSAIANSITATKQQAPQVILVPAPATPAK